MGVQCFQVAMDGEESSGKTLVVTTGVIESRYLGYP